MLVVQSSLRKLSIGGFSSVFGGEKPEEAGKMVHDRVAEMTDKLARRADQEIDSLPFTTCALPLAPPTALWPPLREERPLHGTASYLGHVQRIAD